MPKFSITGGYDDSWSAVFNHEIQARTVEEACAQFVQGVADGEIQCGPESFDPGEPYVFSVDGNETVPGDYSHERAVLGQQAWDDLKLVLEVAGQLTEGEVEEIVTESLTLDNDADFFGAVARLLAMTQGKPVT
jgi:hypothetical protein